MPRSKSIIRTLLILLVVLGVSACGGAPVAFGSLPTPPDATELTAGQNTLADSVVETMQSALGENMTADVRSYELPAGTDFAAVKAFYAEQLAGGDWQATSELTTDTGTFSTAGWQRGGMANEQVLMLGFIPPILDSAPVLIVALFSE